MEAWQSWTIFGLATAGVAYYYTTSGGAKKRGSGWKPFTPAQAQRRNSSKLRNESRDKRRKDDPDQLIDDETNSPSPSAQTGKGEKAKKKKNKKGDASKSDIASSVAEQTIASEEGEDREADRDDLDFAKQMKNKMTGTSLKKPEGPQNKKSRRQEKRAEGSMAAQTNGNASKPNGVLPLQENSTASSTTGADADDDLSSTNSPELLATSTTTPSGGDVSDMLEPKGKGPSILRLTQPEHPQPQRQPKIQKPAQPEETKKQRQARRKKEEQKAIREQVEKERRVAMENQRRTAREAEGRPAKNGLGTSQQPAHNAWSSMSKAGGNNDTVRVPTQSTGLLDTLEDETPAAEQVKQNGKGAANGSSPMTEGSLPSEEEQLKLLSEMESDSAWSTVPKGGKNKKKAQTDEPPASSNGSLHNTKSTNQPQTAPGDAAFPKGAPGTSLNAQANGTPKPPTQSSAKKNKATKETIDHSVWNRSNIHEHPDYDPAYPYALTGHPEDSDWAVV
ncbi:MAG: hypothetical protein OHK93_001727 [Ramalina farinacea]|uniref:Uncharacterized protein n=1 Tax=Ramalina farinacea TaxID=258253 RepID=A0AA43QTE5_9LECA|nr:hypothetical protein [Ramalina farinacea]